MHPKSKAPHLMDELDTLATCNASLAQETFNKLFQIDGDNLVISV